MPCKKIHLIEKGATSHEAETSETSDSTSQCSQHQQIFNIWFHDLREKTIFFFKSILCSTNLANMPILHNIANLNKNLFCYYYHMNKWKTLLLSASFLLEYVYILCVF